MNYWNRYFGTNSSKIIGSIGPKFDVGRSSNIIDSNLAAKTSKSKIEVLETIGKNFTSSNKSPTW